MQYFPTNLCRKIKLPIVKHSDQANIQCYLVLARITNLEPIKEKLKYIKGIISTRENLEKLKSDLYLFPKKNDNDSFNDLDMVECENPTLFWSFLCAKNFPKLPENKICVTGTNGKTSTTWFIYQILLGMNMPVLLINSIGIFDNSGRISDTKNTTPDAQVIHQHAHNFAQKHPNGFLILETSSIAIDQNRIAHIFPQVSICTNFSHEHLDYHKTMEEYYNAKMKLGKVSNNYFVHNSIKQNAFQTYGHELTKVEQKEKLEMQFLFDKNYSVSSNLFGIFQAQNILSAITALKQFILTNKISSMQNIMDQISKLTTPVGRMQKIQKNGLTILIDNAHKPDALQSALKAVRETFCNARIFVVAGCGGDRDKQKRPSMGRIMQEFADIAIITSDNPRSEDASQIANEMLSDLNSQKAIIILNRKEAIAHAIKLMQPNDVLLIAGKGDENYQIFADKTIEFNDYIVAQEILDKASTQLTHPAK